MTLTKIILPLALLSLAGMSQAATVVWSTPGTLSGASDVITIGSTAIAVNLGAANATAQTVNGVDFQADNTSGANVFTDATTGVSIAHDFENFNSGVNFANQTGTYDTILHGARYNVLVGTTATMTFEGLTNGQEYQLQIWSVDERNETLKLRDSVFDDGNGNTTNLLQGSTAIAIGTFTAVGTTQVITTDDAGANEYILVNAIQLRAVPEPSSAALLGLGGLALILRRRK